MAMNVADLAGGVDVGGGLATWAPTIVPIVTATRTLIIIAAGLIAASSITTITVVTATTIITTILLTTTVITAAAIIIAGTVITPAFLTVSVLATWGWPAMACYVGR
jgi:hypothetical protein